MIPGDDAGAGDGAGLKELAPGASRRIRPDCPKDRSHLRRGGNGHQPSSELATAPPQSVHPVRGRHRDFEFIVDARTNSCKVEGLRWVRGVSHPLRFAYPRRSRAAAAAGIRSRTCTILPSRRRGRQRWPRFSVRPLPSRGSRVGGDLVLVGGRWARAQHRLAEGTAPVSPPQFYMLLRIPGTAQTNNTLQQRIPRSATVAQHLGGQSVARVFGCGELAL